LEPRETITTPPTNAKTTKQIRVLADSRERNGKLLSLLEESQVFDIQIGHLRTGDYIIEEQVTVERKTRSDFAIALIDGRLFEQAARLSESSRPIMLVEGPNERPSKVHPKSLKGALLSLVTAWRIPVVFSDNPIDSVWILETLGWQSLLESSFQLSRSGYRPKRLKNRRSFLLQGLPGVGPVLAKRMLERFGTVRQVMRAREAELVDVFGCGKRKAAKIAELLDL
jgi:DNA excision repair protein ERCC-4